MTKEHIICLCQADGSHKPVKTITQPEDMDDNETELHIAAAMIDVINSETKKSNRLPRVTVHTRQPGANPSLPCYVSEMSAVPVCQCKPVVECHESEQPEA